MKDILIDKLKSRKLWVTIGTVAPLIVSGQYWQAVTVVGAYLFAQGAADAAEAFQGHHLERPPM